MADNDHQPIEHRPTADELRGRGWHDVTRLGDFYRTFIAPANSRRVVVTKTTVAEDKLSREGAEFIHGENEGPNGTFITRDQIRAAWEIYESLAIVEAHGLRVVIESIFKELNIERCGKCGGKERGVLAPGGMDGWVTCPVCHDEGWVIGGEDE